MSILKKIGTILKTIFNINRALIFVWDCSRGWTLLNVLLLLVQGALPVASIYLLKILVDSVASFVQHGQSADSSSLVFTLLTALGGIALMSGIARAFGGLVSKEQSRRVADYMHDVIQKKAVEVDLEFYENPAYQDSLHRAQQEAVFRPGVIVNALTSILQNTFSLAGIAWLLLVFRWPVLIFLICAVFPGMIVRFVFSSREYLNERGYTEKERCGAYYHWMLVGRALAKEIRIYNLGDIFITRFRNIRRELRKIRFNLDKKNAVFTISAHVVSTLFLFTAYFWIARDTIRGLLSLGSFVMFYQVFQKGQIFLQALLDGVARLYENNLFLTNLYEFLDVKSRIGFTVGKTNGRTSTAPFKLEIEDVHFSYPAAEKEVLKGVCMSLQAGEVGAVVGKNGSGKTTLVKLICRLYDADHGMISLNGTNIRTLDPKIVRKKIGVIFQDYAHYNLNVRDNIWFGDTEQPVLSEEIFRASEHAGAADFINDLPSGYETLLGRMFENGVELSEGQWQKIALSRAFFRNTGMVILDEPTSSMDPKAEYELFSSFRKILNGRTALLISHRMSTVRMADRIFVLDEGRIVETGSHKELMSAKGIYADLFETQARNFNVIETA